MTDIGPLSKWCQLCLYGLTLSCQADVELIDGGADRFACQSQTAGLGRQSAGQLQHIVRRQPQVGIEGAVVMVMVVAVVIMFILFGADQFALVNAIQ